MQKTIGKFIERDTNKDHEFLIINFSPTTLPLDKKWRNNGLTAVFFAEYLSAFFPGEDEASKRRRSEVKGAVDYIANELLENAMKFSFLAHEAAVQLCVVLKPKMVTFYMTNCVEAASIEAWCKKLNLLIMEDTEALFMQQIEDNCEKNSGSSLGYLTMINDWNVSLAWKFEPFEGNEKAQQVTVMAHLPI